MARINSLPVQLHRLIVLACATRVSALPQLHQSVSPVVDLGYAQYSGTTLAASGVDQYLGIRFAAPPLGDLRWRAPRDPIDESHLGVQPATDPGAICIGVSQAKSDSIDEDCLFLSVYTPEGSKEGSKLPVWVFIQGGGYAGNANANTNGTDVVAAGHDVVFVQLNYRVGALGFLASEKIRADGDLNVGLLDQRQALQWVQKYIHLFGGDPDHVVIHGASAGAGSIAYHMTAYGGRNDGLFAGAIPESPFFPTSRTVAESEFQFDAVASATGCSRAADELDCLRGLDINTFQTANVALSFPGGSGPPDYYFLPVIDGDFSRKQMYVQFARGEFVRVPTLVGGDTNEGDIFVPNATTQAEANAFITDNFPNLTADDLDNINAAYPPTPRDGHGAYFAQVSATYGNSTFACPGFVISSAVSRFVGQEHSWSYLYNIVDPTAGVGIGVTHTVDWQYIFGLTEADQTPVMMGYYLSFIRSLSPNTYKDPTSPVFGNFNSSLFNRLVINSPLNSSQMETVSDGQKAGCDVWYGLASTLEQ